MKRKKVLQVSHSYAPPFLDVANFYAKLFDPNEYEVTSLFLKGKPLNREDKQVIGDKIIFCDTPTKKMRGLKLGLVKELQELIKKEEYEIIIAQRYKAIYLIGMINLIYRQNIKFIGVVHAYNVFKNYTRKLMIKLLKNKITILGVSESIRNNILEQLSSINFKKAFALPNCIPVRELREEQYSKKAAREKLGIAQEAFVFGSAGRLHPEKDYETLIRAFAKVHKNMPNARLYIMGKGRLRDSLDKLISELKLKDEVTLLGMIPEGPRYFKAFDIFVLPSMREPFGMVLIEAMAAGVPIISSNSGGALEIIPQKDLLFEIGNIDQCATLLTKSFETDSDSQDKIIIENNEALKEKYSVEAFKMNFWEIFSKSAQ